MILQPSPPLERLDKDLKSGEWEARYGELLGADDWDLGYRLVLGIPRRI